jgi:hypothetical protein
MPMGLPLHLQDHTVIYEVQYVNFFKKRGASVINCVLEFPFFILILYVLLPEFKNTAVYSLQPCTTRQKTLSAYYRFCILYRPLARD